MEQLLKKEVIKNLHTAFAEVEEHSSQGGVQTCQLETSDIDRDKLAKDTLHYLSYDQDMIGYYNIDMIKVELDKYLDDE